MYRLIMIILFVLLIIMQLQLWQQRANVSELQVLLERQQAASERLRASNAALEAEVNDLRQGMQAIEERARSQLGLIREGEVFIQLVPEAALAKEPEQAPGAGEQDDE